MALCHIKKTIQQKKDEESEEKAYRMGEVFVGYSSHKGLIFRI
jgi:hypothetical protein